MFGLRVLRGTTYKLAIGLIGFAGSVVIARVTGPEVYGTFAFLVAVTSVLDNPITGWAYAGKKRISEADTAPGEILGSTLIGGAFIGLLVAGAGAVILSYIPAVDRTQWPLVVGLLLATAGFKILNPLVSGRGRFDTNVAIDLLRSILTLLAQLALIVTIGGVEALIAGLAIATILVTPVSFWATQVDIRLVGFNEETVRSVWQFAKSSIPDELAGSAAERVDLIIIGTILTGAQAGYYRVAATLVIPATMLSGVLAAGIMQDISRTVTSGGDPSDRIDDALGYTSIIALPLAAGALAIPADVLVTTYSAAYAPGAAVLPLLALAGVFQSQQSVLGAVINGMDRPDLRLMLSVASLGINLGLGILLIGPFGIVGVGFSTLVAAVFRYSCAAIITRDYTTLSIPEPLLAQLAGSVVVFAVAERLTQAIAVTSWVDLGAIIIPSGMAYGVVLLVSRDIRVTARALIEDFSSQY